MSEGYAERLTLAAADLKLLVRRLRSLAPRAWQARDRRDAAVRLADVLAVAGIGAERAGDALPPLWRQVPAVPDHALADVASVTGADALDALGALAPDAEVWTPAGRRTAADVLDAVVAAIRASLDATR